MALPTRLPAGLIDVIRYFDLAPWAVIVMILVFYIILGCVLDSVAIFGAGAHWGTAPFLSGGSFDRASTETIILFMARNDMPVLAGVLLLVGAVAIIFSTATTFLIVPSTNITRDIYQRFINPHASQKSMVLFQRLTIVALAALVQLEGVGYLDNVATFPQARGRGMASAIVSRAIELARDSGAEHVSLFADPDALPVVRMYERLGFREVGRLASTKGPVGTVRPGQDG